MGTMTYIAGGHSANHSKAWSDFGHVKMLECWASELKSLAGKEGTAETWRLTGRAAMLVHNDLPASKQMLQKVATEAGMAFVELSSDDWVESVLENDQPDTTQPTFFFIKQGGWSGKSENDERIRGFQEQLPEYLSGIDPTIAHVYATCGSQFSELASPLRSVGAFDRHFVVPNLSMDELGARFIDQVGKDRCDNTLLEHSGKVGKLLDIEFGDIRRRSLIALAMQRRAHREQRKVGFMDLVYFGCHGSQESDASPALSEKVSHQVAIHEAGHALVCMVDSLGKNIPEFSSIVPTQKFSGVVTDSYAYHQSIEGEASYLENRHQIRNTLAGRAAEEVVFGAENASAWSASSDLQKATAIATALVGRCGFPAELENEGSCTSNCYVVDDEPSDTEKAYIETHTRIFLRRQYAVVVGQIREYRPLLERIAEMLLKERALDQADMDALWKEEMSKRNLRLSPKNDG